MALFSFLEPRMNVSRAHHAAVRLPDASVLVVGGESAVGVQRYNERGEEYDMPVLVPLGSVERFDAKARRWSTMGELSAPAGAPRAFLLRTGVVLVVDSKLGLECIDVPRAQSRHVAPPPEGRIVHAALSSKDELVCTVVREGGARPGYSTHLFDLTGDSWTEVHPPAQDVGEVLVALPGRGDMLWVMYDGTAARFDSASKVWRALSPGTPMAVEFALPVPTPGANGSILLVGHCRADPGESLKTLLFDPSSEAWTSIDASLAPFWWAASAQLGDGRVVVLGRTFERDETHLLAVFDPRTLQWERHELPKALRRDDAALAPLEGGTVLVSGGLQGLETCRDGVVYDVDRRRIC